jgi:hypothetical protein
MRIVILFSVFFALFFRLSAQIPYVKGLFGVHLGQKATVPGKMFGEPAKSGIYTDNYKFESFFIGKDSQYITFEYTPDIRQSRIHSIMISGLSDQVIFEDLKIGDKEAVAQDFLGKPDAKVQFANTPGERWEYWGRNFEIQIKKRYISGIKIMDITPELYESYSKDILPKFSDMLRAISSGDRSQMGEWLSPYFEMEREDGNFAFDYGWDIEMRTDSSHVFAAVSDTTWGIPILNKAGKGEIVESLKFEGTKAPVVTYRCHERFPIKNIQLEFFLGRYRIRKIVYR